jgi:hypothetical protein
MGGNHHLQMVGLFLGYHIHCWTLRGPLGLRAGPMAAKAEARWQQRCRHHGTAWVASESFLLLWNTFSISVESIASGGKGVNQVLALSRTCRVSPMKSNCCGLPNSSPCLEEDTCTILYLYGDDQNIKVWVCESWFGFVRVYLGIPHQFQVHSLSWMCFLQCPNKHLVWCLSVIKRDIPRGVVQISGVKHIRRSEGRIPHAMPNTWHSLCTFWWNTEPINQIESCRE